MDEVTATRLFWNQDFDVQLTLSLHESYIYATAPKHVQTSLKTLGINYHLLNHFVVAIQSRQDGSH